MRKLFQRVLLGIWLSFFLVFLVPEAKAAVAFDFTSNSSNVNVNSITWNHTCTGTDRLLIVDVIVGQVGDSSITVAVTYNGVTMTSIGKVHSNAGTDGFVEMFKLVNPPSGNNAIIASTSTSVSSLIGGSISFTGVEQTVGVLTPVTATGNSNTPSVTITTARKGSIIVDGVADGSTINSSNQTSRFLLNQTGTSGAGNGGGSTAAGGTSVTMSYGGSATDWWAIIAAEVIPSFHLVQHTSNTATATVSVAKAFTSSPIQNNQLFAFCRAGGTGTLSMSDTDGNTWNSLTAANSSGNHVSQIFYVANRLGTGADTVTCNWSGSNTTVSIVIAEYSGLDPLSMVDCQNQAAGTGSGSTLTGASCTTTNANDLIVGAAGLGADTTFSAGSGFVLEESTARLGWEDKSVTSTGSQTPTMDSTATGSSWTFTTAAFKTLTPGGGGGPAAPVKRPVIF